MNIPSDYTSFFKNKLPKSNLEIFAEKTKKPKGVVPPPHIQPGQVIPPPEVQAKHDKMVKYIRRRMTELGLDVTLWQVWYEHIHRGTYYESFLRVNKTGQITPEEDVKLRTLWAEMERIPPDLLMKILEL